MNLSIIIPAYNSAETIAETLTSIQAQTVSDWEAIVVDDGSSDSTAEIANQFGIKDSRIRLLIQSNQGVSAARNAGIKFAKFDWLLFIDADDWISPQYLEKMAEALAKDPSCDAIHCGGIRINADGITILEQYTPPLTDLFPIFATGCSLMIHACVVRKIIVESLSGFDPSFRTSEDWDLWQRIARTGARFGAVKEVLAFYRQRFNSLSRDTNHIFADTLRVVTQGHDFDPRVANPHPDYVQGLPKDNLSSLRLKCSPWFAGFCISRGENPLPLLQLVANDRDPNLSPRHIACTIFQSIFVSSCQPPEIWQQLWLTTKGDIKKFLEGLEAQSTTVGLAHNTCTFLEQMILEQSEIRLE